MLKAKGAATSSSGGYVESMPQKAADLLMSRQRVTLPVCKARAT